MHDDGFCEPCGECARCRSNFAAKHEVKMLRVKLRQAKGHLQALIHEVEFAIDSDAGMPGEIANPIQTNRKRRVTAARKFLTKLEDV